MAWIRAFFRLLIDGIAGFVGGLAGGLEELFAKIQAFASFQFLSLWFASRTYRELLFGLPAAFAFALTAIVAFIPLDPLLFDACIDKAVLAKRAGDDHLAELYLHKARLTAGGTRRSQLNQAILLESLGQMEDARLIISRLAPDDSLGYVPAHQWRVEKSVAHLQQLSAKEELTEQERMLRSSLAGMLESQLRLILQAEPRNVDANGRLALVSLERGELQAAGEHLSRIVDARPDAQLLYAQVLGKLGKERESQLRAEQAVQYHHEQIGRGIGDTSLHRLSMSSALLLMREYERAATVLLDNGDPPTELPLKKALYDVLFQWSESITSDDPAATAQKMHLLDQALRIRPNDPRSLERIAMLAGKEGPAGAEARTRLKQVLASGQAPAVVHFILGLHESNKGNSEAAIRHWELAERSNPNMPITLNNLAVLISRQDPPDLDRALNLIEKAIGLKPEITEFYDSRGQIYLAMEDYTNAIADFEFAIQRLPGRADIHRRLAEAYDAIGDAELARMHRDRAEHAEHMSADPTALGDK